jgi:uncharacterized protein
MANPVNPFQTPGAFSWNELMTSDPLGAGRFYSELFGWQIQDAGPEMGHYNVLMLPGGQGIGGIMQTPPQAGAHPPAWGVYITVADTDATVARATELGAEVVVPPEDIPNVGRFAWLRDPQGAVFAVIAYCMPECEG